MSGGGELEVGLQWDQPTTFQNVLLLQMPPTSPSRVTFPHFLSLFFSTTGWFPSGLEGRTRQAHGPPIFPQSLCGALLFFPLLFVSFDFPIYVYYKSPQSMVHYIRDITFFVSHYI